MGYLDQQSFDRSSAFAPISGKGDYIGIYGALADAGDQHALFELGCAFSTGSHGVSCDLVEAHKSFNLAAARGHEDAPQCRGEIAEEMSGREIAEAQRRARAWLMDHAPLNG